MKGICVQLKKYIRVLCIWSIEILYNSNHLTVNISGENQSTWRKLKFDRCTNTLSFIFLILVCRLALRMKYPKYATDGFTALYTR